MKSLAFALVFSLAGPMAHAEQVNVNVVIALGVCTKDVHGQIVECNASNDPTPIRTTLTGDLVNDDVEFNKTYIITDRRSGESFPLEVGVEFSRDAEILDPKTPFYMISAHLKPQGGTNDDYRMAMTTVRDITAFRNLYLESKRKRIPKPGGNYLELIPRLDIVGIELVK